MGVLQPSLGLEPLLLPPLLLFPLLRPPPGLSRQLQTLLLILFLLCCSSSACGRHLSLRASSSCFLAPPSSWLLPFSWPSPQPIAPPWPAEPILPILVPRSNPLLSLLSLLLPAGSRACSTWRRRSSHFNFHSSSLSSCTFSLRSCSASPFPAASPGAAAPSPEGPHAGELRLSKDFMTQLGRPRSRSGASGSSAWCAGRSTQAGPPCCWTGRGRGSCSSSSSLEASLLLSFCLQLCFLLMLWGGSSGPSV